MFTLEEQSSRKARGSIFPISKLCIQGKIDPIKFEDDGNSLVHIRVLLSYF